MHRNIILSLGVLFACANALFLLYLLEPISPTPDPVKELRIMALKSIDNAESTGLDGRWKGLCPHDPDRTLEQLQEVVAHDSVLAEYYADFDFKRAYELSTPGPTRYTVAHRDGKYIAYTSRTVLIPAGDRQVTDGKRVVRLGCCNDIKAAPPEALATKPSFIWGERR